LHASTLLLRLSLLPALLQVLVLPTLNSLEGSSGEISSPQPQQSTAVPAKHPVWGTPVGKVLPEASVLQPIHE
jgi:hypothetical protein